MYQKEIHIWDFPNNMYIKLPFNYRNIFFQLAFLEFKTTNNLQKILKHNNLPTNIIRWRDEKDQEYKQLIHLKSLLFLIPYVKKRKKKITKIYEGIKTIKFSQKRITKSKELIHLIKELRYIFKGNKKFSKLIDINEGTLRHYINNNKIKTIPSSLVKTLLKITKEDIIKYSFSKRELENKIISYKSYHGKEIFPKFNNERKLPIKITPEFESIIYHMIGDGHVSKIGSSEYTQLNEIGKNNFLQKLFRVFGYFNYSKEGLNNGRIYISKTIISIICDYYNLSADNFRWNKSILPKVCFNKNNSFKLAGLIAIIVDEGYVGNNKITIGLSNQILLSQIKQLALDLDLSCGKLTLKKGNETKKDSFRFNILKRSIKKLLIKTKELGKKYPTCNLAQKENKILTLIN